VPTRGSRAKQPVLEDVPTGVVARPQNSTIELLDVLADWGVDAINWGLVDGRTYDEREKAVFQKARRLWSAKELSTSAENADEKSGDQ
jgi:hypothetical protein